jgi:hypothetical protein
MRWRKLPFSLQERHWRDYPVMVYRQATKSPTSIWSRPSENWLAYWMDLLWMPSVSPHVSHLIMGVNAMDRDNIPAVEDPGHQLPTFPYKVWDTQTNDAVSCITRCQQFGFNAAGLEYSSQCCMCSALSASIHC